MGEKSYLKEQVYLPGLNSYDLFTDAEYDEYMKIVEAKNELNRMESRLSYLSNVEVGKPALIQH